MLALALWYLLGWKAAAAEILVELAIGLLIYGGGGGRLVRASFDLVARLLPGRALASA